MGVRMNCNECGKGKPKTKSYFFKKIDNLSGFHHTCIDCLRERRALKKKWVTKNIKKDSDIDGSYMNGNDYVYC